MDCKYVRQCKCNRFTFNSTSTSFFYLGYVKNKLHIVQQNLYTGLVINQFSIPLKQQQIDVDNYGLAYNAQNKLLIFTLSDHLLIYSIQKRSLIFAGQARGKNPYFFTKIITSNKYLYFSANQQRNIYAVDLIDTIKNNTISTYIKYKIPQEIDIIDIAIANKKLVAICSDGNLRAWELQTLNSLRGIALQKIGNPLCLQFSKCGSYLLIGTSNGFVNAYDGQTLGINNTLLLSQKISQGQIYSICWFHYSGESQSRRFLTFTADGNIKLYSFWFEEQKKKSTYMGKASQLSLLYIYRNKVLPNATVAAHAFANFLMFTPGIILYMVDHYPFIYYPIINKPLIYSFEQFIPNKNKSIYLQRDYIFLDGLEIKTIKNDIQTKISLKSIMEYEGLKILRLDHRPYTTNPSKSYKFLVTYYLGNMVRSIILSKISLQINNNQSIEHFKEYSCSSISFLGPHMYTEPLILILQQDRETVTIIAQQQFNKQQLQLAEPQQKPILQLGPGEIYNRHIKIKVQKMYATPFRNNYVMLYQCQNLLRFSNNINRETQLLDYQVCNDISLRLDYTDIIHDVIWTSKGEIGAVVCLDKIVFISSELKTIKTVWINGYIVQGHWVGYTLIVVTKVDVQYLDIYGTSIQLYCLENYQSKYLIMGILADRIIGIEKIQQKINCKARYFNLMQPLIAGYLTYMKWTNAPIQPKLCKTIIQAYSPYFIVSQHLLNLLNQNQLHSFSQYFIDNNIKLYSRTIRARTLNYFIQMQRFIEEGIWLKNKKHIMDIFLSYWQLQDSTDAYDVQKCNQFAKSLKQIVGQFSINSILDASKHPHKNLQIATNFGDKNLVQIYNEFQQDKIVKMQIHSFKAQNVGEWVGLFGSYIQSSISAIQNEIHEVITIPKDGQEQSNQQQQNENQFKDLVVYYRFDQGKGQIAEDLSDFGNQATISAGEQCWIILDQEPMELQDKWGKKCPPQFSINFQNPQTRIIRQRKINLKKSIKNFTISLWMKPKNKNFIILNIGKDLEFGHLEETFYVRYKDINKQFKIINEQSMLKQSVWNNVCWIYDKDSHILKVLINTIATYQCQINITKLSANSLCIGNKFQGQITQFRIWKKIVDTDDIKDNMRSPLQIVAEKKRRLKMKIRGNKTKKSNQEAITAFQF